MEFLSEVPQLVLSENPGKQLTFCADIFQPRPPFEEIQSFASWSVSAQEQIEEALKRKKCAVAWAGLFVDKEGMVALVQFKHRLILGDAKKAAETVLHALPEEQRHAVEFGLRPLDELDQRRIEAWKTPDSVRPDCSESESDSEEEADPPLSMAALLALHDERPAKRRRCEELALIQPVCQDLALLPTDRKAAWVYIAQQDATIHVASAGDRPEQLSYIHCHREARRVDLLKRTVEDEYDKPTLRTVVQVAVRLANEGALPGHRGPRARKTEFLRRCEAAMQLLVPGPQPEITKAQRQELEALLAGIKIENPQKGCLNPACNGKTTWVTQHHGQEKRSRCKRCGYLKSFGRTWHGMGDLLRGEIRRQMVRVDRLHRPVFD